jgi:phosphoglycerol transferase
MQSYEQFRGYLADSGKFRWSYGAMKGRPQGDWQARLPAVPTESDLRALLGLGFTGIWVNRDGYDDHGKYFESSVAPLLGKPDLVSRLSDLSFYDLRPFAADIKPGTDLAAAARQQLGIGPPAS